MAFKKNIHSFTKIQKQGILINIGLKITSLHFESQVSSSGFVDMSGFTIDLYVVNFAMMHVPSTHSTTALSATISCDLSRQDTFIGQIDVCSHLQNIIIYAEINSPAEYIFMLNPITKKTF